MINILTVNHIDIVGGITICICDSTRHNNNNDNDDNNNVGYIIIL